MGKLNFLILGAQRCGTTSLWNYCRACPELTPVIPKEDIFVKYPGGKLNLYGKTGQPIKETKFFTLFYDGNNLKDYEDFFTDGKGFEASVEYFHFEDVPEKIKRAYQNNLKFIVLLRDPVKRAWSHYWHEVNYNKSEHLSFDRAIKRELKTIEDKYFHAYLLIGHYAKHLKRWFDYFDRKNFLIIQSEQFFKKPEFWFKKIQLFLDCQLQTTLTKYPNISIKSDYPAMDFKMRKQLEKYFEPYNQELYNLLD